MTWWGGSTPAGRRRDDTLGEVSLAASSRVGPVDAPYHGPMTGRQPVAHDPIIAELERSGVDWRQLLGRLRMSPDERLRHLEEFIEDVQQLRQDLARSRSQARP